MDRSESLARLGEPFDVCIIGGGATGLGCAVDSASRGYRTVLLEANDFAQATSSRSTKLVHGGVRYLEQGDIKLVREALHERGILLRNAPHLVHELRFLVPAYRYYDMAYYGAGLKAYDLLAGKLGLSPVKMVTRRRARQMVPTIRSLGLRGGLVYSDGQFNDSRLAIAMARTAEVHGAAVLNYMAVRALQKAAGTVNGVVCENRETGQEYTIAARTVINAAGIFTDSIRRMDQPDAPGILSHSRGSHIVLDRSFLPGDTAILVPKTEDGRVVFIIPWEGRTLVGTTDIPVEGVDLEPEPSVEEIDFLLHHAGIYLEHAPRREDILATFAGLRPLVKGDTQTTAKLSRDHTLLVSDTGLITITGGKWTTYRRMAQDAVDRAAVVSALPERPCVTEHLPLARSGSTHPVWRELGAGTVEIAEVESRYDSAPYPGLPYSPAMAAYVIEREIPIHLDDVLSRRLRALLLDAGAAVAAAPDVARIMAEVQGRDDAWVSAEVERFTALAQRYGAHGGRALPGRPAA